ncbi:MAG: hypothetical protein WAO61_04485 [Solirubrobacterales bacterium]
MISPQLFDPRNVRGQGYVAAMDFAFEGRPAPPPNVTKTGLGARFLPMIDAIEQVCRKHR